MKKRSKGGWQVSSSKDKWEGLLRGLKVEDNMLQIELDLGDF